MIFLWFSYGFPENTMGKTSQHPTSLRSLGAGLRKKRVAPGSPWRAWENWDLPQEVTQKKLILISNISKNIHTYIYNYIYIYIYHIVIKHIKFHSPKKKYPTKILQVVQISGNHQPWLWAPRRTGHAIGCRFAETHDARCPAPPPKGGCWETQNGCETCYHLVN